MEPLFSSQLLLQVFDQTFLGLDQANISVFKNGLNITDQISIRGGFGNYSVSGLYAGDKCTVRISATGLSEIERNVFMQSGSTQELFFLAPPNSLYYEISGIKIPFEPNTTQIALLPTTASLALSPEEYANRLNALKAQFGIESELWPPVAPPETENFGLHVLNIGSSQSREEVYAAILQKELGRPGLFLRKTDNDYVAFTHDVRIVFLVPPTDQVLNQLKLNYGIARVSIQGTNNVVYRFDTLTYEMLDKIADLKTEKEVYYISDVELIHNSEALPDAPLVPTDFLFQEQWDHTIMQTPEAWGFLNLNAKNPGTNAVDANYAFGSPKLVIGISDNQGIDLTHPEFSGTVQDGVTLKQFSAWDFSTGMANNGTNGNHGTNCASGATANANNASVVAGINEGVVGVAAGSRLGAFRPTSAFSNLNTAEMYMWQAGVNVPSAFGNFSPTPLSASIDVASGSYTFELGSTSVPMQAALDFDTEFGRMGRGIPMFFSAGNLGLPVAAQRPWGVYERGISVGATWLANSGQEEQHASYSNYGPGIFVCALSGSGTPYPVHNPPAKYGAWVADRVGNGGAPGHPLTQGTVIGAPSLTQVQLSLAEVAGFVNPAVTALIVGTPGTILAGSITPDARKIDTANINAATGVVPLFLGTPTDIYTSFNNTHVGQTVYGGKASYKDWFNGTSYATPVVAGLATLVLTMKPQLSWLEIKELIKNTARKVFIAEGGLNPGALNYTGRWYDGPNTAVANMVLNAAGSLQLSGTSTTLSAAANTPGNLNRAKNFFQTTLNVVSKTGFEVGDAVQITDGVNTEIRVVEGLGSGQKIIVDALRFSYTVGSTVTKGLFKPIFSEFYGYGRINAYEAVKAAKDYSHAWRDLVVRDYLGDTGLTDTNINSNPIHSPDIWIRNQNDPALPAPLYNQDGPHQNPDKTTDRYIYVRVKNIGNGNTALPVANRLTNLDAWVHVYIALSDGVAPPVDATFNPNPGINTPFLFPGDLHSTNALISNKSWMEDRIATAAANQNNISGVAGITSGNMRVYHVRDTTVVNKPNIKIAAGTIVAADAGSPETGTHVVKIKWNQADIPPVGTAHKIYVLAYVSPVDGERQGRGAELNNNMSFREISFAKFNHLNGSGTAALPNTLNVDNIGTVVNTPFKVQFKLEIGSFIAEDATVEVIRLKPNGQTDHLIFVYNTSTSAWELLDYNNPAGTITWGSVSAPVVTTTSAAASGGGQTDITFSGNFDCTNGFDKITIKPVIRSQRVNTLWVSAAEDKYEIVVNKATNSPTGSIETQQLPDPISYAFADMSLLTQTTAQAFGPHDTNPTDKFRVTSSFTATTDVNAYAVIDGLVMLQRDPSDTSKVNLILRPITPAIPGFTPVRYYVYRGLRLDDFLDVSTLSGPIKITPSGSGNSEFVQYLHQVHTSQNPPGTDFLAVALGYDPTNQPNGDPIDKTFFRSDTAYQLPYVTKGMQLGRFFHNGGSHAFGFEVLLDDGLFTPDFAYARSEDYHVDVSGITGTTAIDLFQKKLKREHVLAFIDPAAFYGMHHTVNGYVDLRNTTTGDSDPKSGDALYDEIVAKFDTKNHVYIDVRNEVGRSYNFFENYDGSVSGVDAGKQLQVGTEYTDDTTNNLTVEEYKLKSGANVYDWPLLALSGSQSVSGTENFAYLKLRSEDNTAPVLYNENGKFAIAQSHPRFVADSDLLPSTSNPPYTKAVGFSYPNRDISGNKLNVARLFKLRFFRRFAAATSWHTNNKTIRQDNHLDHLFGAIDLKQIFFGADKTKWRHIDDKRLSAPSVSASGAISSNDRGAGYEFLPGEILNRAVYYVTASDIFSNPDSPLKTVENVASGSEPVRSFMRAGTPFNGHKLVLGVITESSAPIITLRFNPNPAAPVPSQNTLAVCLSAAEVNDLMTLPGATLSTDFPRNVTIAEVGTFTDPDNISYKKYSVGLKGLKTDGTYGTDFPGTGSEIFVYSVDGFLFASAAYTQLEPLPTAYDRNENFEEATGLELAPANLSTTGATMEDAILDLTYAASMKAIVTAFANDIDGVTVADTCVTEIEGHINTYGPQIFSQAVADSQTQATIDDRVLYWARIKMRVKFKEKLFALGKAPEADKLEKLLERKSRGFDSISFSSSGKKILVASFDPFLMRYGSQGAYKGNLQQSNSAGCSALSLHGQTLTDPHNSSNTAEVQAVVFPLRYTDFNDEIVESVIKKYLDPNDPAPKVDEVVSVSISIFENEYLIDRFSTKHRKGTQGNMNDQQFSMPVGFTGDEFYDTTFPVSTLLPSVLGGPSVQVTGQTIPNLYFGQTFQFKENIESIGSLNTILDGTVFYAGVDQSSTLHRHWASAQTFESAGIIQAADLPTTPGRIKFPDQPAEKGSGGAYFSNELHYRISRMRQMLNPTLPTGHLHIEKIQKSLADLTQGVQSDIRQGEPFDQAKTWSSVNKVKLIISYTIGGI